VTGYQFWVKFWELRASFADAAFELAFLLPPKPPLLLEQLLLRSSCWGMR
jgi:hypothetical protein